MPQGVDVFAVAVDKIHRHIQRVLHIAFKTEPIFEHKGQHAGACIIQVPPNMAAPAFLAIGLAFEERRIGKQRRCHRLQRQRHAQLLHHVGLRAKIDIDLNRAGPAHHGAAHGADFFHVVVH